MNNGYAYIEDIKLYGPPNPALAQILVGPQLRSIMGDYTLQVAGQFIVRHSSRPYKDLKRQYRSGGHPPGQLLDTLQAGVSIGGYKADRWVGEVSVGDQETVYGAADEYGRKKYNKYRGDADLREALHAVLPNRP